MASWKRWQLDGVRPLLHVVLGVQEGEDSGGRAHRLLKVVVELRELADGIVELEDGDDEGQEGAGGEHAGLDAIAAHEEQQRNGDGADGVHQGRAERGGADGAKVGAEQALGGATEAQGLPEFHAEGLHDAIAGDGFVQDVVDLGELVLPAAGGVADAAADAMHRDHDERNEQQQHPGQLAAEQDNHDGGEDQGKELLQELGQHGRHGSLHALDVVDQRGEQRAGGEAVKEGDGAAEDGVVEVVAQVGDQSEAGVIHQVGAGVVEQSLGNGGSDQRKGDHGPRVVKVTGNKLLEVDGLVRPGRSKEHDAVGLRGRAEDAVEDGADQQHAKGIEQADQRQQHHRGCKLQDVGSYVAHQAPGSTHQRTTGKAMWRNEGKCLF